VGVTVRLEKPEEVSLVLWLADLPGLEGMPPARVRAKLEDLGFYATQEAVRAALAAPPLPKDLVERVARRLGERAAEEVRAFLEGR
jgi:hypothetical protein